MVAPSAKKERYKLIPEVYLLLVREGNVLLSRRKNTGYEDGKLGFVAGHAEENEPLRQAMVREAMEESGIKLDPFQLVLRVVLHRKTDREQVGFYFQALEWNGEPRNMEPNKCAELAWFPLDHLPKDIIPYIARALECFQKGILYDEIGWGND